MEKELIISEYLKKVLQDDFNDTVFYSERPGKMVDLETAIFEKLFNYCGVSSVYEPKEYVEGWKKIAEALISILVIDYGIDKADYEGITKDDDKINYSFLYRSINADNPKEVIDRIKILLAHRELAPEQILFGLGLILDKNKEAYITSLKQDFAEMKHQLNAAVNENNKFRERLNKAEKNKAQYPLKKKVVIVRNKVVAE